MNPVISHASKNEALFAKAYHIFCANRVKPWSYELFCQSMKMPQSLVVVKNNDVLAYAIVSSLNDVIELEDIAVKDSHQRMGIAFALMNKMIADAKSKAIKQVFLEVAANNSSAYSLYERCGFVKSGLRKNYYLQSDKQQIDAILMSLSLA